MLNLVPRRWGAVESWFNEGLRVRRRPPQSNYPSYYVPLPDHGRRLESQHSQGGISPLAPPSPRTWYQSLPPILRSKSHNCEKGMLFVREKRIGPLPSLSCWKKTEREARRPTRPFR